IKLLKNINGLWILQELQRYWAENGSMYSYEKLITKAQASTFNEMIDVEKAKFVNKCNMYQTIRDDFIERSLIAHEKVVDFVRVVINSLEEKYNKVICKIKELTKKQFEIINMVGGGIQNELLCEITAKKTKRSIITGPVEASGFGNVLSQLIALKLIESSEIKSIISNSIELKYFD